MAKRIVLKTQKCPICGNPGSIRKILWGMPNEEPDPSKYVTGGCCVPMFTPDYACIECDWTGVRDDL